MPQLNKQHINDLVAIYKSSQRKIIDRLNSGDRYNRLERSQILRQIEAELGNLGEKTDKWTEKAIKRNYQSGMNLAYVTTRSTGMPMKLEFNKFDREQVSALIADAKTDAQYALNGVKRSSSKILSTAQTKRINAIISEGIVSGETRKEISQVIANKLKNGNVAIIDKAGREWTQERYAKMLGRTKLNEACRMGTMNQLLDNGHDLVQVSAHAGSCKLCQPYEGQVLSITGRTKSVQGSRIITAEEARSNGLFHPNCGHRLVPFHQEFAEQSYRWSTRNQEYQFGKVGWQKPSISGYVTWLKNSQDGFIQVPATMTGVPDVASGLSLQEQLELKRKVKAGELSPGQYAKEIQGKSGDKVKELLPQMEEAINQKDLKKAKEIIKKWEDMGEVGKSYAHAHKNMLKWL